MDPIPQRLEATAAVATLTFDELRSAVLSACGECHRSPASNGDFSYTQDYASLAKNAEKMAQQLVARKMPPENRRALDPPRFDKLGARLMAWIAAGKPETDAFELPGEAMPSGQQLPPAIASAMTDIGDCVPVADVIGKDADRDAMFARLTALPASLADTDLVSLDAYELARRGTVAYDVEYPLWADNAHKGRWVHVPAKLENGVATRQPITFDAATGVFQIPDNTRFYKTFFKSVKDADGAVRYRKVETRIIVVRKPPGTPLFGTYLWDAAERGATLVTDAYRDGTPFKDVVLQIETDATTHAKRTYAVPGRTRCSECHQGSESDSFVLGFTPLQVNRRDIGGAGREAPVGTDELSQLTRLASYGVVAGITPDTAPRLETTGGTRQPANTYELRYQAYTTGNCAHCHNQKGYAAKQGIAMLLSPPNVFQFRRGVTAQVGGGTLMLPSDPVNSVIYKHVRYPTQVQGTDAILHMPLHTPGIDCNGVNLLGKWITSIPKSVTPTPDEIKRAMAAADSFDSGCQPAPDLTWLDEDFSDPPVYQPRRQDWNSPSGMPDAIRALELTTELIALADKPVPMGYWASLKQNGTPLCAFPDAAPPEEIAPWMLDADQNPKRPWGELRYQKPGEYFFQYVCAKCHGPHANADSGLAKTILALTGGVTRVANLHDGLFGHGGNNTSLFDVTEPDGTRRNLAPNYLVWMASGGTLAEFPKELREIIGEHGGNMLFMVRNNYCAKLLDNARGQFDPTNQTFQLISRVCTFGNPTTPDLGFKADKVTPVNADAQSAWLDRAVRNVGFSIYRYLLLDLAVDHWSPNSCRDLYPAN